MNIRFHTPRTTAKSEQGFSLVELLLTLVLILCLAAASVFTFTAVYRTSNLDEGVDRFQSLIRFAQAEASTTGRKVRLQFVPCTPIEATAESDLRDIKVTWESDLLNSPGVFEAYTNKAWSEKIVNELVGVQKVKTDQSTDNTTTSSDGAVTGSETSETVELDTEFPSITFYPDGSCDSAAIVLASRNPDDERRLEVHLSGLLGSVSTRTLSAETAEESDTDDAADAEFQEYNDLFESSQPVQASSSDFAPY